jgi:hypothetical protein
MLHKFPYEYTASDVPIVGELMAAGCEFFVSPRVTAREFSTSLGPIHEPMQNIVQKPHGCSAQKASHPAANVCVTAGPPFRAASHRYIP